MNLTLIAEEFFISSVDRNTTIVTIFSDHQPFNLWRYPYTTLKVYASNRLGYLFLKSLYSSSCFVPALRKYLSAAIWMHIIVAVYFKLLLVLYCWPFIVLVTGTLEAVITPPPAKSVACSLPVLSANLKVFLLLTSPLALWYASAGIWRTFAELFTNDLLQYWCQAVILMVDLKPYGLLQLFLAVVWHD